MFPLNVVCLVGTKSTQLMVLPMCHCNRGDVLMCHCDHRDVLLSSGYWCHGDEELDGHSFLLARGFREFSPCSIDPMPLGRTSCCTSPQGACTLVLDGHEAKKQRGHTGRHIALPVMCFLQFVPPPTSHHFPIMLSCGSIEGLIHHAQLRPTI